MYQDKAFTSRVRVGVMKLKGSHLVLVLLLGIVVFYLYSKRAASGGLMG
jgi:hypothetical protein